MADRRSEQRARREARETAERDALRAAGRQRRVQYVAVGALAVVLVVGVIVAALGSGGDDGPAPADRSELPTLPAQQTTDLAAAVRASGCTQRTFPIEGRGHEQRDFSAADYRTNPPTSGAHFPNWAQDGVYAPGTEPQLGLLVHTLEHGRIDVQYRPDAPAEVPRRLEAFVAEDPYHMVMFRNPTGMRPLIAFTAWGQSLTCDTADDRVWDAARAFRDAYVDKGPEKIP